MTLTDNCPMPFGAHKGVAMANVPDAYLKWLWERHKSGFTSGQTFGNLKAVMEYIKDYGPEHLKG